MGLFNFLRKNKNTNPYHKYVTREHWFQLKRNCDMVFNGDRLKVIEIGLKYEDNINHTGDVLLLFDSFFVAIADDDNDLSNLQRRLANKFATENLFKDFDDVDRQYMLNLAALILEHKQGDEVNKNDPIFAAADGEPIMLGVNPLLTTLFRIEKPDPYYDEEYPDNFVLNIPKNNSAEGL